MKNAIAVFARAPVPGEVKTRLAQHIGNDAAAELYAAMLRDSLTLARRAARTMGNCEVVVAYTPVNAFEPSPHSLSNFWSGSRMPQCEGDLGDRMLDCIARLQEQGAEKVVLIGSDTPDMTPHSITSTFSLLQGGHLEFCQTRDGGFNLIGASMKLLPKLFADVEWSTEQTLSQITANATLLGLGWSQSYKGRDDVDTMADLRRLIKRLQGGHAKAPETWRWLRSQNLLQGI